MQTFATALLTLQGFLPDSAEELQLFFEELVDSYGYAIVFVGAALDFCLPSSGDITMLLGGWFASGEELNIALVILFGALGGLVSENTMYWTGRIGGRPLVERVANLRLLSRRGGEGFIERAQGYFDGHGGKTVFIGRLIPGFRALIPLSAGMCRMPYGRFLFFDCLAVGFWAVLLGTVGYVFGEYWEVVIRTIRAAGPVVVGAVALTLISVYLLRRRRRGAKKK